VLDNGEIKYTGNYNELVKLGLNMSIMGQNESENKTLSNDSNDSCISGYETERSKKEKVFKKLTIFVL
jgi:hypothetical protein